MKNPERVAQLLAELRELADNDFELHRIDVLERDLSEPPTVEIIDEKHQKFDGFLYAQTKSGHYMTGRSVHRAVWQYYYGTIPENNEIHHVDENPANNYINNLRCLPKEEHALLHGKLQQCRVEKKFICEVCGKEYYAKSNGRNRYCSTKCMRQGDKIRQQRWVKICEWCGKKFKTKFQNQRFCSHSCATTARYAHLREKSQSNS